MDKNQKLVLIVAILASFVAFLDGSVVNVALPAISHELGGGLTTQQWVVDAYLITLGACILIAGSFSDLFGRKRILTYGLIGFGAASILCAVAPSAVFLVSARALQGIAGALLVPSSLALIISAFSGPAQGAAIGRWTAWTGIAFLVGPILGGFMVDAASWRLVFAINVLPIAVVLWLMRRMQLPEQIRENTKVDVLGAVLCVFGLGLPVYALIEQPRYGWSSPIILGSLIVGLAAFAAFIWHEKRTRNPMLPLELFKVRNFGVGNLATTAIYAGLSSMTFLDGDILAAGSGLQSHRCRSSAATDYDSDVLPIITLRRFIRQIRPAPIYGSRTDHRCHRYSYIFASQPAYIILDRDITGSNYLRYRTVSNGRATDRSYPRGYR
jgi:EmrB/QacA subfamily drug resistance transporter